MKLFILECSEDELKANRGIMDSIMDACRGAVDMFYGTYTPCPTEPEEEPQESEEI